MSGKKQSTTENTKAATQAGGGAPASTEGNNSAKEKKKTPKEKLKAIRPQKMPWTLERVMKIGKQYSSESAWFSGSPSSYKSATAHGWVAQVVSQMNQATNGGNNVVQFPKKPRGTSPLKKAA